MSRGRGHGRVRGGEPRDRWGAERRRFLVALNAGDAGAAYYTLGRVRMLAELGEIEDPAWADRWAMRRIRWLDSRVAADGGRHEDTDTERQRGGA